MVSFWENYQRLKFWPILEPKWPENGASVTHIVHNSDGKPVETFLENGRRPEFWPIWGPKWLENQAFEAHIEHTSNSEHVQQCWWETRGNFFATMTEDRNLTHQGPKITRKSGIWSPYSHTSKSSCDKFRIQIYVNPVETFWENSRKPHFFYLFGGHPKWLKLHVYPAETF